MAKLVFHAIKDRYINLLSNFDLVVSPELTLYFDEAVDKIIHRILYRLRATGEREVSTQLIGEWVMDELKALDAVAYVRFASVYRQFKDVGQFMVELKDILGKEKRKK